MLDYEGNESGATRAYKPPMFRGLDSDEMSPLYENRCLTVGLVQIR